MQQHIAKHFALQLGSLVSLYITVAFFITLVFGLISVWFPLPADSYWQTEQAVESIRLGFAVVVIFFPVYVFLTRLVNVGRRQEASETYLGLTKWLIYLSLLVGGAVLLTDLAVVVYTFLEGDMTVRFILKALTVLVVTALAFSYYVYDVQGYWVRHERASIMYAVITTLFVVVTLGTSLFFIETPAEARELRVDKEQINDLQDMQWQIEDYYRSNDELPDTIETLYGVFDAPAAPEGRAAYRYAQKGDQTYELCATFARDSEGTSARPIFENNFNWQYKAGEWCFDRTVDDERRL